MIRRGSDEAVLRPVPWQLRANYRVERSVFVGDPVFRSAFDGTKCRGIEDKIATSSRDTYRVSLTFVSSKNQVHNIDRHTTRKT